MHKLTRILAVLDGSDADAVVMAKAATLVHQHSAALELFVCDAPRSYNAQHTCEHVGTEESRRECVREWRRYLECLRDIVVGVGVPISVDVVCASPLCESIVRKALQGSCDLVIKNAATAHPSRRFAWDANDWQLMSRCPTALLLSRGKPWQAYPRLAAAVDVSENETLELPEAIVRTSALLAKGCHGDLDVLYSEPRDTQPRKHKLHVKTLEVLTRTTSPSTTAIHILSGSVETALPLFAVDRGYDAFIMGALSHWEGIAALAGTLAAKLVETLDCDFVLVKPEARRSQADASIPCAAEEPELEKMLAEPCAEAGSKIAVRKTLVHSGCWPVFQID
jgi:universal stress protein E